MSYDNPHACYVPHGRDVFGFGSIVDEFENTLGLFDDGRSGSYLDDFRFQLFNEDDASPGNRDASSPNLND